MNAAPRPHFTSLHKELPAPPTITAGLMGIHTDGAADAVISHSLWETSPRQESCDPGKMGHTCTRARCIHDGPGSSGSDTIWVKCPVGQSKFGETVSNNEMGDEVERVFFVFLGVFSSTSVKFTCNNNHEAKDFLFLFPPQTDLDERQDKKCPAIAQICNRRKKKLHPTPFRVAVHEEGVNSLATWSESGPPV